MEVTPLSPDVVQGSVETFRTLLRFNTVNPPGNERPLIDWVADQLTAAGIESTILESAPGRANLVARLKGGSEPAIVLTGHVDVVAVEPEHWSVDPFAAEEKDGWIYGRGAVDMKHHVAMCITVFLELARRRNALNRDVILLLVADEEAGSRYGMRWMVENHADLFEAGYGLNEFGGFNIPLPGNRRAWLVQTAERGFCWFRLRAHGQPGHGSLPPADSAVEKLTAAIQRLCHADLPYHLTPAAQAYLDGLARAMGPLGFVPKLLKNRWTEGFALRLFPDPEQANAVRASLHNTAVPTVIRSGEKTNVVPGTAEVEIDGRYLPGFTEEQFLDEVRQVVGDGFDIDVIESGPPAETTLHTPLLDQIHEVMNERTGGEPVVPWMLIGFSDTKWLQTVGIQTYGFSPIRFPDDTRFTRLPHGHDERAPRDGYEWGVETLWQTVARFCTR
ncbi:MAG: M20/M25/M40 family metallo-hydrolase [Candidatus Dadabacteria bacterium]|nr:MAG: M20/M25/M40 family metallo-hydrolase [Candidatus Dadabacteria bacterium]